MAAKRNKYGLPFRARKKKAAKKRGRKKGRKKARSAAQRAATAKLVAANKRRAKGRKPKSKRRAKKSRAKKPASRRTAARHISPADAAIKARHKALLRAAIKSGKISPAVGAALIREANTVPAELNYLYPQLPLIDHIYPQPLAARVARTRRKHSRRSGEFDISKADIGAMATAHAARAARAEAKVESLQERLARFKAVKSSVSRMKGVKKAKQKQLIMAEMLKRGNPMYFPRRAKSGKSAGTQKWWIADVFGAGGKKKFTSIGHATRTDAERGAMQLLVQSRASTVQLSGPYSSQPTASTARK